MKTIVSLALAGLMSISALLPALAAQEAENVSIPESSGISESMAQDENTASGSGSLANGSAVSSYVSTTFRDLFSYSALIVVLLFMPNGLLGKNAQDKL